MKLNRLELRYLIQNASKMKILNDYEIEHLRIDLSDVNRIRLRKLNQYIYVSLMRKIEKEILEF